MKKTVLCLLIALVATNCAKTRSCTCNSTTTVVTATTPENGSTTSKTDTYSDTYFYSNSHFTKSDIKENSSCIGYSRNKAETYTTSINTPTTFIISGISIPGFITTTANVVRNTNYESTCEIK